jgi:uncharacterized protein (DUF427 family)
MSFEHPSSENPESVWDYPRPPLVVPTDEHVMVRHNGVVIVDTRRALRVLETSHPPSYYVPLADVAPGVIEPVSGHTICEFKGKASYGDLVVAGQRLERCVWWYEKPWAGFSELAGHVALYPGRVDECTVDGEKVQIQEGDFYGGWITSRVKGPFKGAPGTLGW